MALATVSKDGTIKYALSANDSFVAAVEPGADLQGRVRHQRQ